MGKTAADAIPGAAVANSTFFNRSSLQVAQGHCSRK
jgi:hypothetical protein